jgi:hypothetical protein
MRVRIAALSVALVLLGAASAEAFQWHLGFALAKHETRELVREACKRDRQCVAYGVGPCQRISESRIDCIGATLDATASGERQCSRIVHWGVKPGGYIKVRLGPPHCVYLE